MGFLKERLRIPLYYFRYLRSFLYDLERFVKHSNVEYKRFENTDKLIAKIISLYHVIEKGLALEEPRLRFGKPRIEMLMRCITIYTSRIDKNNWDTQVHSALSVLDEYLKFNHNHGVAIPDLEQFLVTHRSILSDEISKGGTKAVNFEGLSLTDDPSFDAVVSARSSIRNFGGETVAMSDVYRAVRLAQKSPSTCNRQSARILMTTERNIIDQLLFLQKGTNGFGHKISSLLIVCCDLNCYQGDGDRVSGVIDGSLFGMTLIHALTRFKIASIPLNWSKDHSEDKKLRRLISVPDSYSVLFFIGLGSFKSQFKVPQSNKNDLSDICADIRLCND